MHCLSASWIEVALSVCQRDYEKVSKGRNYNGLLAQKRHPVGSQLSCYCGPRAETGLGRNPGGASV